MQRLRYIDKNGTVLDLYKGGAYILDSVEGTGSTGRKISSITSVVGSGEFITGARRQGREVVAKIAVAGGTREGMYKKRMELCDMLSLDKVFDAKGKIASRIVYENDHGQWWTPALLEDEVDFKKRLANYNKDIKLTFRCPSSFWYGMSQEKAVIAFSGKAFSLPFRFPISFGSRSFKTEAYNKGSIATPVEIEIHGQGETPSLYNASTGKRIKLKSPVPVDHRLVINTDKNKLSVRLISPQGESLNAFGLLDPSTPVSEFVLKVGANELVYEHGAEAARSKIEVRWYTSHEGV